MKSLIKLINYLNVARPLRFFNEKKKFKKMKKCICPLEHACKVDMRIVDSVLACHCQVGNEGVYSSRRRVYKKK